MEMKDKILHYFRDINYVYNDCTKYEKLKAALDRYQEETILTNLRKIKKMCRDRKMCEGCLFRIKNSWAEYCVFSGPHWGEGVNPEDWELDELVKEEGE